MLICPLYSFVRSSERKSLGIPFSDEGGTCMKFRCDSVRRQSHRPCLGNRNPTNPPRLRLLMNKEENSRTQTNANCTSVSEDTLKNGFFSICFSNLSISWDFGIRIVSFAERIGCFWLNRQRDLSLSVYCILLNLTSIKIIELVFFFEWVWVLKIPVEMGGN